MYLSHLSFYRFYYCRSAHLRLAGFTYCAIGALSFLDRLPHGAKSPNQEAPEDDKPLTGLQSLDRTIRWLVSRQTATLDEDDAVDTNSDETDTAATCHDAHSFVMMHEFKTKQGEDSYKGRPMSHFELQWTGFNGRVNKIADTCYAFWVMGSLGVSFQRSVSRASTNTHAGPEQAPTS